jgi:FlaA1/EpsC-like NDP-sugar epimerase
MTRAQKRRILLSLDGISAAIALPLAIVLVDGQFPTSGVVQDMLPYVSSITIIVLGLTLHLGLHRVKLNAYQLPSLLNSASVALSVGGTGLAVSALGAAPLPLGVFPIAAMVFLILTVSTRLMLRHALLWIYKQKRMRKRVLIYGAGQTGQQLAAALATDTEIQPVAFIDDNPTLQSLTIAGLVVHSPTRVEELLTRDRIDRIVLAMPSVNIPVQARIAARLRLLGCEVHALPSFADLVRNKEILRQTVPMEPADLLGRLRLEDDLPGVSDVYVGRNILVTGAGGSIGSEICRQLISCRVASLILLDHSEPALYAITRELEDAGSNVRIVPILGSICEASLVRQVIAEYAIDMVMHAAAYKHVPLVETNMIEGVRNNVLGTRILAEEARAAHVERFILISTDKAVRPVGVMGCSKRLAEMMVQDLATRSHRTQFAIVRFGNVLGSSGSVVPLFQDQIARGGPVTLTHDDVTRYFMTISEAVRLVLLAGTFTRGNDVFVLDMGAPVQIRKIARQMIEAAGFTVRDATNPRGDIEIVVTGLRPGEKLHEELLIGSDMLTTPHPKILRAQEGHPSQIEIAAILQALRRAIDNRDSAVLSSVLIRWVETGQPLEAMSLET